MNTSSQRKTLVRLGAVATLTIAAAGSALAGPVTSGVTRGAVAVTTSMGAFSNVYPVGNVINQSGLSTVYVSGATAFDAYVASATSDPYIAYGWLSQSQRPTGSLSFDLGAEYSIDGLAWFGIPADSSYRVNSINVYADNDSNAANGHDGLLFTSGTFAAPADSTDDGVKPNVFNFSSGVTTRYVTVEILGNAGADFSGVSEVVFRESAAVEAVPEPGTCALVGLGLLAMGITRRRRMAQR